MRGTPVLQHRVTQAMIQSYRTKQPKAIYVILRCNVSSVLTSVRQTSIIISFVVEKAAYM